MPTLPRCPPSLIQTIADVLATAPLLESLALTLEGDMLTTPSTSRGRIYSGIVALTGPQLIDFSGLVDVAASRAAFVWADPADGVEKLVTFAAVPNVITKPLGPIPSGSRIAIELDLLYDKMRGAAQVKDVEPH